MVYTIYKGGRGEAHIARKPCNRIAIVWALQVWGGPIRRIDSCTQALKMKEYLAQVNQQGNDSPLSIEIEPLSPILSTKETNSRGRTVAEG